MLTGFIRIVTIGIKSELTRLSAEYRKNLIYVAEEDTAFNNEKPYAGVTAVIILVTNMESWRY